MSNGIIVQPFPIAASQISMVCLPTNDAAFPAANMIDPQPKTVAQSAAQTGSADSVMRIDIDLGADYLADTVAVMFTNLSAAASWVIYMAPAAVGTWSDSVSYLVNGSAFGVAPSWGGGRHALWTVPATSRVLVRYLRIYLIDTTANSERLIRAGVVLVGARVQPVFNFELGSGFKVDDQSITRTLPGGETAIERGGITPIWRATWSNLTEVEFRSFGRIIRTFGKGAPLLLVEDPDAVTGQPEAMHYGLLEAIDFTERTQIDKQRIDMVIRELV